MKLIQISIALTAIALLLTVALLLQDIQAEPCDGMLIEENCIPYRNDQQRYDEYSKDLPPLHFNWTPINERTEKPKDIPTLHFNQLER